MSAILSTAGGGLGDIGGDDLLHGASRTINSGGLLDLLCISLLLLGGFM